jgi:hypothetical protein
MAKYPKYPYYIVHKVTGLIVGGADYKEDAIEIQRDLPLDMQDLSVLQAETVMSRYGQIKWAKPDSFPIRLGYHCSRYPLEGEFYGSLDSYQGSAHGPEIREAVFGNDRLRRELSKKGITAFPDEGEDTEKWSNRFFRALSKLGIEIVFVAEEPLGGENYVRSTTGLRNDFGRYCAEIHLAKDAIIGFFPDHHVSGQATAILYDVKKGRPQIRPVNTDDELEPIEFPDSLL